MKPPSALTQDIAAMEVDDVLTLTDTTSVAVYGFLRWVYKKFPARLYVVRNVNRVGQPVIKVIRLE